MNILIDDLLINILNILTTKELFKFCICNQLNFAFLERNIKYFKFNFQDTFITNNGLEYFKGVVTSGTAVTSDVVFSIETISLPVGGIMIRIACGMTI